MDFKEEQRIKTVSDRANAGQPWFIMMDNWGEDLNSHDIHIADKNGNVIFTVIGGSLELAAYLIELNNQFVKERKNAE